ncbi:hypothetical protein G6M26_50380 [Agrobacterium tumefaciens]|nr:hypothetical protein [Agrobacterium tumefaciens]NTE26758.1 hypothetical protein [Agrobacterium tumefaciens]
MKKLLFVLVISTALSCSKNIQKVLTEKTWAIESVTVTPAITMGDKTSTNYIELSGPESCVANLTLTFSKEGTYVAGTNGALCDMRADNSVKTWKVDGDKVILSASADAPLTLAGDKLTQTTTSTQADGKTSTFVYVYKPKSK